MITKPDPAQWFERVAIRSTRLLPATAACVQTHVNKPITLQTLSNLLSVTVSKRMSCKESPIVQLLQTVFVPGCKHVLMLLSYIF